VLFLRYAGTPSVATRVRPKGPRGTLAVPLLAFPAREMPRPSTHSGVSRPGSPDTPGQSVDPLVGPRQLSTSPTPSELGGGSGRELEELWADNHARPKRISDPKRDDGCVDTHFFRHSGSAAVPRRFPARPTERPRARTVTNFRPIPAPRSRRNLNRVSIPESRPYLDRAVRTMDVLALSRLTGPHD